MGLDVTNSLLGNYHFSWRGAGSFCEWCAEYGLPEPFVGWDGCNDGDQCVLGSRRQHNALAKEWCVALEQRFPDAARLGKQLLEMNPEELHAYLYGPSNSGTSNERQLSAEEWLRRDAAAWYAILRHGIENGDILEYW